MEDKTRNKTTKKTFFLGILTFSAISLTACGGNGNSAAENTIAHHPAKFSRVMAKVSNAYSPTGDIKEKNPTFTWKATANATDYMLGHEDTDNELRWQDETLSASVAGCLKSISCSYTPQYSDFAVGDEKVWWVRAKVSGKWEGWSAPYVFTIVDDSSPVLASKPISPKGEIDSATPTFTWTPGNGATQYEIGIESDDSTLWDNYILTPQEANCQSSNCSFKPSSTFLKNGDKADWWVREFRGNDWENWSEGSNFSVGKPSSEPPEDIKKELCNTSNTYESPSGSLLSGYEYNGHTYTVTSSQTGTGYALWKNATKIGEYTSVPELKLTNGALYFTTIIPRKFQDNKVTWRVQNNTVIQVSLTSIRPPDVYQYDYEPSYIDSADFYVHHWKNTIEELIIRFPTGSKRSLIIFKYDQINEQPYLKAKFSNNKYYFSYTDQGTRHVGVIRDASGNSELLDTCN